MAESEVFDFVCGELESRTDLDRIEARGTIRLALREAGLEARTVNREQMSVVVTRVLRAELDSRGISDGASVCTEIDGRLATLQTEASLDTPEAVFERLGG